MAQHAELRFGENMARRFSAADLSTRLSTHLWENSDGRCGRGGGEVGRLPQLEIADTRGDHLAIFGDEEANERFGGDNVGMHGAHGRKNRCGGRRR